MRFVPNRTTGVRRARLNRGPLVTGAQPAERGLTTEDLKLSPAASASIYWNTAIKAWAREQAASAPPLSAEAARIICSALRRAASTINLSPGMQFERQGIAENDPGGSRDAS